MFVARLLANYLLLVACERILTWQPSEFYSLLPTCDSLETTQAQQGVVGHRLYFVPLQVDVSQVLHASDGSRDPPEVVLEAEQFLQHCLFYEDAVGDVEEVTVWQVQTYQLLQPSERSCMKITDVLVVCHFQGH